MVSILKFVCVLSCGFPPCLGLFYTAQTADSVLTVDDTHMGECERTKGFVTRKEDQNRVPGNHMVRGDVLRLEDRYFVVKEQDGKEVSLQIQTAEEPGIHEGDHIEASVNDQNQIMWFRSSSSTDEHRAGCTSDSLEIG